MYNFKELIYILFSIFNKSADVCIKNRLVDGTPISLELWDTPGKCSAFIQKDSFRYTFLIYPPPPIIIVLW